MSWPWMGPNSVPYPVPPSNLSQPPMMHMGPPPVFPNLSRPAIPFPGALQPSPVPFSGPPPPPPPNFDGFMPHNEPFQQWAPNSGYHQPHAFPPAQPGAAFQFPDMPPAPFSQPYPSHPPFPRPGADGFPAPPTANLRRNASMGYGRVQHQPKKARTDGALPGRTANGRKGLEATALVETGQKVPAGQPPVQKKKDVNPRDAANCAQVLKKLGASLPGESKEEVDKWIAARRKNWPSRANVARKLAERAEREARGELSKGEKKGSGNRGNAKSKMKPQARKRSRQNAGEGPQCSDSLQRLATEYCSSSEGEEEGEIKTSAPGKNDAASEPRREINQTRQGNGAKNKKRANRNNRNRNRRGKVQVEEAPSRPSLLRRLLEDEIQKEQSALLQAFRHILSQQDEQS